MAVHAAIARGAGRPAIPPILDEHLEEAGFLWLQRRRLLFSPDVPLRRLSEHDERIAAHLDALAIGGRASAEVALARLEDENPWILASALRTWLDEGVVERADAFARLDGMPPAVPSWREALRWVGAETLERLFPEGRTASLPAPALALAIEPLARTGTLDPAVAATAARHADPGPRAALARVLAWAGTGPVAAEHLAPLAEDRDPAVRRRARWSAALRDPAAARERLREARPDALDPFDARTLGLIGEDEDARTLAHWAEHDPLRAAALAGLGDLGTPEAVETLLRLLAVPDDAIQLEATAGLERALGPLAGEEGAEPAAAAPADAAGRWEWLADTLAKGARACRGHARPWTGVPADEPAWWSWRAAAVRPTRGTRALQREVPDGFWNARETLVAQPGE